MSKFFSRPELASKISGLVMDPNATSSTSSGLFLAAPRRTGKSTFLREDLRPHLVASGALVVYVDLWADRNSDPGELIVRSIRDELARHEGAISRLAKSVGLESISIGGVSLSMDKVGLGAQISLSAALAALSDTVKKPIVLVIDEAQHAITTQAGYDALFALKAARDELNSSTHHGLRVIATGSNRDKLAMLRNSKDQAFFSAPLIAFPPLDSGFVRWFCAGTKLPVRLDESEVLVLFEQASFRPEILASAADSLRFNFDLAPEDVQQEFSKAVEEQIKASDEQYVQGLRALPPLQFAVLAVMANNGAAYAPFEQKTLAEYQSIMTKIAPTEKGKTDVPNIQQALAYLQEKSLVWREKRGVYSLEESAMTEIIKKELVARGSSQPPKVGGGKKNRL